MTAVSSLAIQHRPWSHVLLLFCLLFGQDLTLQRPQGGWLPTPYLSAAS